MFLFKRKKSTTEQEFDFNKMMTTVRQDPEHLEQVQAHYRKYYHHYGKKSTELADKAAQPAAAAHKSGNSVH